MNDDDVDMDEDEEVYGMQFNENHNFCSNWGYYVILLQPSLLLLLLFLLLLLLFLVFLNRNMQLQNSFV